MKALVVNAAGRSFDLEDVDVASPIGREVLIEVQASGLCHTDLLFAANNIAPFPAVFGYEVSGVVAQIGAVHHFAVRTTGDHRDGVVRVESARSSATVRGTARSAASFPPAAFV